MDSSNLIEDRIIELEKFEIFKEGYFKDIQIKIFSSKKNNNYQIIVSKLNETEITELSINYIKTIFLKYIGLNLQNFVSIDIESMLSVNKMSYKYTNYTNKIYNKDTLKNLEKIKNELSDLKNIEIDDFDIYLKKKEFIKALKY
jgi:hypothetical protein